MILIPSGPSPCSHLLVMPGSSGGGYPVWVRTHQSHSVHMKGRFCSLPTCCHLGGSRNLGKGSLESSNGLGRIHSKNVIAFQSLCWNVLMEEESTQVTQRRWMSVSTAGTTFHTALSLILTPSRMIYIPFSDPLARDFVCYPSPSRFPELTFTTLLETVCIPILHLLRNRHSAGFWTVLISEGSPLWGFPALWFCSFWMLINLYPFPLA